jgi:hypothetical protein
MLIAEDISSKAIEERNQGNNLQALQAVVDTWARQLFWNTDAEAQTTALEQASLTDAALRRDLADAIAWNMPLSDTAELTLLAVDAARGPVQQQPAPALFGADLDWAAWKKQPDLKRLQELFVNNTQVRNAFARAMDAYPGKRHLGEIAAAAVNEIQSHGPREGAVQAVLQQYVLNWGQFRAGLQDRQFLDALTQHYEFREQVARAIHYRSSEAERLAGFATNMWRTVPLSCWFKDTRLEMLSRLDGSQEGQALRAVLQGSANQEPDDAGWGNLESQLTGLFADNPNSSRALWGAMEWPRPFALVLREELRQIESKRQLSQFAGEPPEPQLATTATDASDLAAHKKLFAVAFSGGGIRSATFNLGVLQKLSDFGLLGKVDYLSTVSGGGYVGAWLAAWIKKNGHLPFDGFLSDLKDLLSPQRPDPRADSQRPIRFLREFSNYLTPRLGSFSFDTWTMAAVYTRNLVLNQAIIIAVLGTLLLVPRLLLFPMKIAMPDQWMAWVAAIALFLAVLCMSLNMRNAVAATLGNPGRVSRWLDSRLPDYFYDPGWVQALVIINMLAAVYFGSLWTWRHIALLAEKKRTVLLVALLSAAVLSLLLSVIGGFVHRFRGRQTGSRWWGVVLLMVTVLTAGATLGLLQLYFMVMQHLHASPAGVWHAEIWGPVMLLTVLVIPGTLQIGLMGVDFPDPGREWMSRYRAVCSIYATYWIALLSAVIYGPLLMLKIASWSIKGYKVWISGLTLGWVITTISGLVAGNSKVTGTDKDGNPTFSWVEVLAKLGPPVFILGLILLLATLEQLILAHGKIPSYHLSTLISQHWTILEPWPRTTPYLDTTGWMFVLLAAAGGVLAWRVDINEFSMHHFYKNRLVRCYLGASNDARHPNPFTGFDGKDDFSLSQLRAIVPPGDMPYLGPYPIVNTTLNLSVGKELAWQERKGASFIFTPCFCGFDVQGWANATGSNAGMPNLNDPQCGFRETLKPHGYRATEKYTQTNGPLLGTAMSVSGAAANPNQGYNTSPAVSFLMTVFDVRLGWWLGNPRRDATSILSSPRFGLAALVSELLGSTDDETRFVNLSDGGHFDNMGLYELVRRRCSFILLCDAEQDGDYKFEGLGSAIRKCRVDFGALIEIDPVRIKPEENGKFSESHCAVGKILYLDGSQGTLVYIKASMTGDEPEDVMQFHAGQPHFPHETTADQWFGESQFESYRALGYHATHHSLSPATGWLEWDCQRPDAASLFCALEEYWYPVNPNLMSSASKHTGTLSELLERIRQTPSLYPLGAELFPGSGTVPAGVVRPATEEFYFGMCILQLMEDLYFDFQLDRKEWLRDPRIGGWRFLFQRWKAVPAVAAAWTAERDTFRKDFQLFWKSL